MGVARSLLFLVRRRVVVYFGGTPLFWCMCQGVVEEEE
jgi:hypothetical protein